MRIFHLAWDATTGPLPAPTKVAGAPQPEGRWQAPDDAALDCKTVKVIYLELHPRKGSNQMRKAIILAVAISAFATIYTSSSFALSPSEARDACLREREELTPMAGKPRVGRLLRVKPKSRHA